jgi:hypothetical protein
MKQRPVDFVLLGAGVMTIFGSLTPWFSIVILNIAGTDTGWGFVTLGSGVLTVLSAAARIWPNLIQSHLRRGLQIVSVISGVAALASVSFVGLRLTEVSRGFDDSVRDDQPTTETTIEDDIFGELAKDLEKSLDEFSKSIAETFMPRLALGWYLTLVSTLGSLGLLVWQRRDNSLPPETTAI